MFCDSFATAAATAMVSGVKAKEHSDDHPEHASRQWAAQRLELRARNPEELMVAYTNQGRLVFVKSGLAMLVYSVKDNTYFLVDENDEKLLKGHSPACIWAGLLTSDGRPFASYRLLADARVNGTDTYVLELRDSIRSPMKGVAYREYVCEVYLGKNDLLPRRVQWLKTSITPSGKRSYERNRSEYLGFVVNPDLPDDMFILRPPLGAKVK